MIGMLQNHGKAVTAQPIDAIPLAHVLFEHLGNFLQHLITIGSSLLGINSCQIIYVCNKKIAL